MQSEQSQIACFLAWFPSDVSFPVEKHILGDQWAVDVHLSKDQSTAPREGIQAALENLDEKTKTVLLVDDNADDALLK